MFKFLQKKVLILVKNKRLQNLSCAIGLRLLFPNSNLIQCFCPLEKHSNGVIQNAVYDQNKTDQDEPSYELSHQDLHSSWFEVLYKVNVFI